VTAQRALNGIAKSPEGAQAIFNADVFGVIPKLLNSRGADVREWTVKMIKTLAAHGFKFIFEEAHGHSPNASSRSMIDIEDLVSPSQAPLTYADVFL
jgi:hypothetical protein